MILYNLEKDEAELIKDIITNFIFTAKKEEFKKIDKKTDKILDKLNKPIIMNNEIQKK